MAWNEGFECKMRGSRNQESFETHSDIIISPYCIGPGYVNRAALNRLIFLTFPVSSSTTGSGAVNSP
jgi:hypothetical protein